VTDQGKHDQHEVEIIVNTRPKSVKPGVITYDEVVALVFDPVPTGPNIEITITWYRGQGGKSGDLLPGNHVAVHEGMVFDATATDLS
jgi:multiubiquitin